MKIINLLVFCCLFGLLVITSCSSSKTGENSAEENKNNDEKNSSTKFNENFDLTPYHEKISIPEASELPDIKNLDIWYTYLETDTASVDSSSLVRTMVHGYRVVVLSTDDLNTANELKSELYSKTKQKNIYLDFEPPFYKVKVGDFTDLQDANNLKFKLNQLGYKDSRVISEDVNVFKPQN